MAGATTSAPKASPSHQSNHNTGTRLHGWTPARHRVTTPTVALMAVHAIAAMRMRGRTPAFRRKPPSNRGSVRSQYTAVTASRQLPVAITNAVHAGAADP